jgi:putative lipoic acid-binding regulatory protein
MPETKETLLEFPCAFPIKVMGLAEGALEPTVLEIVLRHDPGFAAATMERRASSGGKYLSLTCTIQARSKLQLDTLYRELSSHPLVKVAL